LSILPLDKLSNPGFLKQLNCQMTKVAIRIYLKKMLVSHELKAGHVRAVLFSC
jgi:hypothetical protein